MGILKIVERWKRKQQERKQAEHEQLLQELAEMVDTRRKELLEEKA